MKTKPPKFPMGHFLNPATYDTWKVTEEERGTIVASLGETKLTFTTYVDSNFNVTVDGAAQTPLGWTRFLKSEITEDIKSLLRRLRNKIHEQKFEEHENASQWFQDHFLPELPDKGCKHANQNQKAQA